jgi:hypothetical protein
METKRRRVELPTMPEESCSFEGYDAASLMAETAKLQSGRVDVTKYHIHQPVVVDRNVCNTLLSKSGS